MAYVTKYNDTEFVFGLKWEVLGLMDGVSAKKEKEAVLKREGMEYGLFYTFGEASVLGMAGKAFKGKISAARAAVQATNIEEQVLYVIDIGKGKSWFVAVSGGAVMPGTDVVGTSDEIEDAVAHFEDYDDFEHKDKLVFEDDVIARAKKDFRVKRFSVPIKPFVVAAILLGISWYGYSTYQAGIAAEKAAKYAELQRIAAMNNTTVEEIEKIDDPTLARRWSTHLDESILIERVIQAYKDQGGITKGWELTDVMCDDKGCYLDFKGKSYADPSAPPSAASVNLDAKIYSVAKQQETIALLQGETAVRACSTLKRDVLKHNSAFLNIKMNAAVKKETGIATQESRLRYGTLSINGRFFTEMSVLSHAIYDMKAIKIKTASINYANTWLLTGEYICQD